MALGEPDDRALRTTFNEVAASYGRVRPRLPAELFDELVALTDLPRGGRLLEVGCGTGQPTMALAERGYAIVAVELGDELAAFARRNLASYPNVEVEVASFEDWTLASEPFDVVTAFNAWHWVDPAVGLRQAARALRAGGAIAIVGGSHVAGGDTDFFNEMQDCYERHMPGTPKGLRLQAPDEIPHADWRITGSADFSEPVYRRWTQIDEYTTATYFDLLRSFSGHIALDTEHRDALFSCLETLLESRYGGRVRRATLTELCVARRR